MKVNQFVSHRDDRSGAGAVRKSTKFTKTTKVNQFLSHRHNDGDGAGAVRKYTGRYFPSISDLYSDAGGSKDGIGTEVLLHPLFSQSLPEEVKKEVKDKGGMAGLTRPANPPPLVSSTIHGKEDKDVKEGDSDVFNNIWTKLESAGAQVYVKTSNPPPLVSKATVVSKEDKDLKVAGPNPPLLVYKATLVSRPTIIDTPTCFAILFYGKEDKDVKEGDSDVFNNMWTQLESAARCPSLHKTSP